MPRYKMTKEGKFVLVDDAEERILPVGEEPRPMLTPEPEAEEEEGEDLSDMFEAPSNQRYEREDLSDLFEVTEEDIMGEEEIEDDEASLEEKPEAHWADEDIRRYQQSLRPQPLSKPFYRRTAKRYIPPQPGIGGTR